MKGAAMVVKEGSKWQSPEGKIFHVLSVIEVEGHTWVHYIEEHKVSVLEEILPGEREYSCYVESFVQRFRSHDNH
jgi:hypothetical protein